MRAADWIAKRLKEEADVIFGVTGGCIVNCVDGFFKQGLKVIPMHHEQCAAMAADGYARVTGRLGLCYATSGPGGQNLLTGIASAFYDSVPVIGVVGQVPSSQVQKTLKIGSLRQYGFQESHNAKAMEPVSKFASLILDSKVLVSAFNAAIHIAMTQRRGPVVIDLPDDLQRAEVDGEIFKWELLERPAKTKAFVEAVVEAMRKAQRPILILGAGIRQAGCQDQVEKFVEAIGAPVLLTWGGKDLLEEYHPQNFGGIGVCAERTGNYAMKHADLIVSIGCRMDTHTIGPNDKWLQDKEVIVLDLDDAELKKLPDVVKKFRGDISDLFGRIDAFKEIPRKDEWHTAIKSVRDRFSICKKVQYPDFSGGHGWDPYCFVKELSKYAEDNAIVVGDAGQTLAWLFQAWETKKGQILFSDFNNSCMGYALPAAIGAAVGCPDRPVYCVIGDGSLMMNLQELQTIAYYNLNIKVVVINNGGYGMIMQTQSDWDILEQDISCNERGGLSFPSYKSISDCFGLKYYKPFRWQAFEEILGIKGPMIIDADIERGSKIAPKQLWGDDLWNQKPYLDEAEKEWIENTLSGK